MKYQLITSSIPQEIELTAVERVLTNRGIPLEQVQHYLNTTDEDINDPLLLDNMGKGAEMLLQHIHNNSHIHVVIDSDCDGYTSAALLINYLNVAYPNANITYNLHPDKEHGILLEEVPIGVNLIIAPDSSSNQYEIHEQLASEGIDILVLDHHEAEYYSEHACVINNQLSQNYPNKTLSGVGVTYKFCSYLDCIRGSLLADRFLDLVALGVK